MLLEVFLDEAVLCLARQNGPTLADCLSCWPKVGAMYCDKESLHQELNRHRGAVISDGLWRDAAQDKLLSMEWDELCLWRTLFEQHLLVIREVSSSASALELQLSVLNTFLRLFATAERWTLPVLYALTGDLWQMARNQAVGGAELEECCRAINRAFVLCLNDRAPLGQSRRWGCLKMSARLFACYAQLGQLNLCNNVLRALGTVELPDLARFPPGQVVQQQYWLGRYAFLREEYAQALGHLQVAYARCDRRHPKHIRMILHYLIPCRLMLEGIKTQADVSPFYSEAFTLLRCGRVGAYTTLLDHYECGLLRMGTYAVWQRAQWILWRNCLRHTWLVLSHATRLSLVTDVQPALRLAGWTPQSDVETEELACLIAILIGRNLVKGYLSQERGFLVLSAKEPFPAITQARLL